MIHLEKAILKYVDTWGETDFIQIKNCLSNDYGQAPKVEFTIQSAPIGEVGINGVQCVDMLKYTLCLLQSLNEAFPCSENSLSITKMQEAIMWQEARTKDRERRDVEGENKA